MQIDWPRYIKTAKEQGLTGIEVVRLIQWIFLKLM